ncbi:MAG: EAL domain-containing protein [Mailhella sp.]|nr:EAL domain-containing protein [Mailhella sp.]
MVSPGVFIPLFEKNDLIRDLDNYVWREAAAQVRDWKERLGISVPVSVNVSRVDIYDQNLVENFVAILNEYELTTEEFLLEITESAYTQDSEQLISTVDSLRSLGFKIEMDDFGTGYSSLNMLSTLPIDALKLDMLFIRNAFKDGRDTRLIEAIIDIADSLGVPVIAEGVETEDQLKALRAMGCDIVQGYYFSKPLPPDEYECFFSDKPLSSGNSSSFMKSARKKDIISIGRISSALTSGYESIYYVDADSGRYVEFNAQGRCEDLQIQRSGTDFFADTQSNLQKYVYKEDRERVSLSLQKNVLLDQLMGGHHFAMTYRLVIGNAPTYYHMLAVRAETRTGRNIVIGVSNMENQLHQALEDDGLLSKHHAFFSIAKALSMDFESVYYVDLTSGAYTEFTAQGAYEELEIETTGKDFFAETQINVPSVVYSEDIERVSHAMRKENLLAALDGSPAFSLDYRLMINGTPAWYRLKAVKIDKSAGSHIVIGISDISSIIRQEIEYKQAHRSSVTFASIAQTLAADYFSIYYVDTETDEFIEYSSYDEYRKLGIEKSGGDFFALSRSNIRNVVYPEDQEKILRVFTKENILAELKTNRTFTTTYRLLFDGAPCYVCLKAIRMEDADSHHIVIGVNNCRCSDET